MRRSLVSIALAGALFASSCLYASSNGADSSKAQSVLKSLSTTKEQIQNSQSVTESNKQSLQRLQNAISQETAKHKESLEKTPKEVIQALQELANSLKALQKDDTNRAKKALSKALKLFNDTLKNNPKLKLVPISDIVEVNHFPGNSKLVKHLVDSSKVLLDDYDTQAARAILLPLEDEMDMITEYLPIGLFADATKVALKQLNLGKTKEATSTIISALNTIVTKTVIMPLPLITAQSLVVEASKLNKKDKEKALKLLSKAEDELNKAIYLGYTKKHSSEYKKLQKEIKNIEKEIKGKNFVAKLYEKIKKDFKSLIKKLESENREKSK